MSNLERLSIISAAQLLESHNVEGEIYAFASSNEMPIDSAVLFLEHAFAAHFHCAKDPHDDKSYLYTVDPMSTCRNLFNYFAQHTEGEPASLLSRLVVTTGIVSVDYILPMNGTRSTKALEIPYEYKAKESVAGRNQSPKRRLSRERRGKVAIIDNPMTSNEKETKGEDEPTHVKPRHRGEGKFYRNFGTSQL